MQGVGLHSGVPARVTVHPVRNSAGICFRPPHSAVERLQIKASYRHVKTSALCTLLEAPDQSWRVSTVEHLMAAFSGLSISDAAVEIDGPEVPLLDGGSGLFALALRPMIDVLEAPLPVLRIKKEVKVTSGKQMAALLPNEQSQGLDMHVSIDFTVCTI